MEIHGLSSLIIWHAPVSADTGDLRVRTQSLVGREADNTVGMQMFLAEAN